MASGLANLTRQMEDSLGRTVVDYMNSWRLNNTRAEQALEHRLAEENFQNVIWYLIVMIGMFAFVVVAILVSTVKSKRREHSDDPYHQYIEEDWTNKLKNDCYVLPSTTPASCRRYPSDVGGLC